MQEAISQTAADVAHVTNARAHFELKGTMAPLTVLRLKSKDLGMIERQLRAKVTQMPGFFIDAPVVIDPSGLEGGLGALPLQALVSTLRACKVVPVGISGIRDEEREAARSAGLGVLTLNGARPRGPKEPAASEQDAATEQPAPAKAQKKEPATPAPVKAEAEEPAKRPTPSHRPSEQYQAPTVVIREPVRSGQEIYAKGGDLIVLAPVNPGAQIWADGNIHIYSTLRGRAMAGADGFPHARVFVQKLEAEMVAVAGVFLMTDEMPQERLGKPAQVYLDKGECRIGAL